MKKFCLYFLLTLLFMSPTVIRAESWDDYADLDKAWDGQKTITNKEFEQVMDALQAKTKKKEEKKKKKLMKKISGGGTSLHSDMSPESNINKVQNIKPKDEGILINLPVDVFIDDKVVEKGYYKVIAEKDKKNNSAFVNFYQSQYLIAKLQVSETNSDFDEEEVNFAKILPYDEHFVKMIFGSLDFNAYAVLPIKEDI